jgi:hypothetical protein
MYVKHLRALQYLSAFKAVVVLPFVELFGTAIKFVILKGVMRENCD